MTTTIRVPFFFLLAAGLLHVAAARAGQPLVHEPDHGRPGNPEDVVRTVRIEAAQGKCVPSDQTFKVGETAKFVLVNNGERNRELTIGGSGAHMDHRSHVTVVPHEAKTGHHHVSHNAIAAKPGETKELVWTFKTAGVFEFACNVPGHAETGTPGKIIVD